MTHGPGLTPSWAELAARARRALQGLRSMEALVHVHAPVDGVAGEAATSALHVVFTAPDTWQVQTDDVLAEFSHPPGTEIAGLGWGRPDLFLDPPDFQQALSGPDAVTVNGRNAYEVRLAAPGSKPYVLRLAIDDVTGLVIRYSAEGTDYVVEVVELEVEEAHS